MIENELWEAFPEPSEQFQRTVKQAVADQLAKDHKRKRFLVPRSVAAVLVCLLMIGTTVGAVRSSDILKYMNIWGHTAPEEEIVRYTEEVQGDQGERPLSDSLTFEEIESSLSGLEKANLDLLRKNLVERGAAGGNAEAEEMICSGWTAEPFLLVDEVYMDGSSLFFSAHSPEGCSITPTDSMDHAYVNGVDCLAEYFEKTDEPGHYVGSIDLSVNFSEDGFVASGDELAILMRLYTKPDGDIYDTRIFSFSDKNWNGDEKTRDLSGTEAAVGDYGSVEAKKLLASPSKVSMELTITLKGEDAGKLLEKNGWNEENGWNDNMYGGVAGFFVEDNSGKRYSVMSNGLGYETVANSMSGGVITQVSEDVWQYDFETAITKNFDMESDYIRMIPFTVQVDEDGKCIPGTERAIEEMAFVLPLK